MIQNNHIDRAKNGIESVIDDSVRTAIIRFLRNGKPKRFMEIKKHLDKHDFVIKRELDILVEKKKWVIKTGNGRDTRYSLDITNNNVKEYLKHADLAIPSDSEIKEVKVEFCYEKSSHRREIIVESAELPEILSCLPEEHKKFVMKLIDEPYDFEVKHRALMKKETTDLFNKIQIHAILEKNTACTPQMNDLDYEDLIFLIYRLLQDQIHKIYEIEIKKDRITAYKNYDKIRHQVYDKPFKLIISYNPKKD